MPSDRKQLNIRLSDESHERLARLLERLRARKGADVSQAGVVDMALIELEKFLDWLDDVEKKRRRKP